jgi:carboxymethylenebutenolidase
MKRATACLGALLVLASPAFAQVKTSEIKIKSGDGEFTAYVAQPEGKGPFPGVVVIQEWWGLNDWIKDNAKRIAAKGYVAIAPDLYHGKVTDDPKIASQLIKGLPKDRAVADLKATVAALADMPNVKKERIGSIGWCMGGGYSLELAINDSHIKACVMCYGRVVSDQSALKKLNATVLGVFGENDKGIPARGVREFEAALKEAGKPAEKINIYEGAGHGFMRAMNGKNENPEYRAEATKDAWSQIDAFFNKMLTK